MEIYEIIEVAGLFFWAAIFVITLMIKDRQSKVKEELVANQNELGKTQAEFHSAMASHFVRDDERFTSIGEKLVRIEVKLDRLNGK